MEATSPINSNWDKRKSINQERNHKVNNLNQQLSRVSMIRKKLFGNPAQIIFEEEAIFDFIDLINDFDLEETSLHKLLEQDKMFVKLLDSEEKHAQITEKALKIHEQNLRKYQDPASRKLTNSIQENDIVEAPREVLSYFRHAKEAQTKISELEITLKTLILVCFRTHKKKSILQKKLLQLKSKSRKDAEQLRLSYQLIESASRFKINYFDGNLLSGCLLPIQCTLQNSHSFKINVDQDHQGLSDWLWQKIYNFSVPQDLTSKKS